LLLSALINKARFGIVSMVSSRDLAADPRLSQTKPKIIFERVDVIDIGFGDIDLPTHLKP